MEYIYVFLYLLLDWSKVSRPRERQLYAEPRCSAKHFNPTIPRLTIRDIIFCIVWSKTLARSMRRNMRNLYNFILVPLLRRDTWQVSVQRTEVNRIFLSFSFLVVVEIGVQRSVQMAVRDKKNFARIYRYWPIVIDAPPFPVQMGKIVFPFFSSPPSLFCNRKRERKVSIFQQFR